MAYWKDTWRFSNSIEYEYKFAGNYGAKGDKRGARKKATPEQIKKQNQSNKEKKMRRLIKANFIPEDIWATLKYPKGIRKPLQEVKKDISKFLAGMRNEYKKRGDPFKFIYRLELGERGGIHIHMLVNRSRGEPDTDVLMQKQWKNGRINFQTIYEFGGFHDLASYIVKMPDDEVEKQLNMFEEEEKKEFVRYSSSRNLIRPEPERECYRRWTVKKLIESGPEPTPGYYIEKESIYFGINRYTGMSYYQYAESRIKTIGSRSSPVQGKQC